jgi:hypothetical protein
MTRSLIKNSVAELTITVEDRKAYFDVHDLLDHDRMEFKDLDAALKFFYDFTDSIKGRAIKIASDKSTRHTDIVIGKHR